MLGVGFFAGVKATTPDMQKTIDTYFDNENLFDIKVVSTLGLTDDDIKALQQIEDISEVYGSYSEDVFVNTNEIDNVVKVIEITDEINNVKLVNGKMSETSDECVIEESFALTENIKIGDKLTIKEDLDEDEESSFVKTELTVVGTVNSPLYISRDKGTSNLGSGKLAYYMYVPQENISEDIYTEIYAKAKNASQMNTTSKEYSNYIDGIIDDIEDIKSERQDARYNSLVTEANNKLNDAEKEFNDKKAEGEKEIDDAEKKIKDGEKKVADGQKELQEAKDEAYQEFSKAEQQLIQSGDQLNRAEIELNTRKTQAEQSFADAENQKVELQNNLKTVQAGIEEINANYSQIEATLQIPNLPEEQKATLEATKIGLEQKRSELQATEAQLTAGIEKISKEVEEGRTQLDIATHQIMGSYNALGAGWAELNSKKEEANAEFVKAEKEIADAQKEITDGKQELADAKQEFDEKIKEAEDKILDARQKIADIEEAKWYIWDRSSNSGYDGYISDTKNIEKLGNVFPILFFVIAILISLTSMSRMVEEQRIELRYNESLRIFKCKYLY